MKRRTRLMFTIAWICLEQLGCSNDRVSIDASNSIAITEAGYGAEAGNLSSRDAPVGADAVAADCSAIQEGGVDSPFVNEAGPEAKTVNDANPVVDSGSSIDSETTADAVANGDSAAIQEAGATPGCPPLSAYRLDKEIVLREIPREASGIAWNRDADTFFIVANLQGRMWEYDRDFQTLIRTIRLENVDIDTEGIAYLGEGWVAIAVESNYIYLADLSDGVATISGSDSNRVQPFRPSGAPSVFNAGLEGVAYLTPRNSSSGRIFSCQEHLPMRVLQFEYDATPPPFEQKSALDGTLQVEEPWDAQQLLSPSVTDISGMTYDESNDTLLIVSQESRSVIRVDPQTGAIADTLLLVNTDTSEGITLFDDCQLAVVSEPNRVQIYRPEI
jgi:uncharacterized protein YjiK